MSITKLRHINQKISQEIFILIFLIINILTLSCLVFAEISINPSQLQQDSIEPQLYAPFYNENYRIDKELLNYLLESTQHIMQKKGISKKILIIYFENSKVKNKDEFSSWLEDKLKDSELQQTMNEINKEKPTCFILLAFSPSIKYISIAETSNCHLKPSVNFLSEKTPQFGDISSTEEREKAKQWLAELAKYIGSWENSDKNDERLEQKIATSRNLELYKNKPIFLISNNDWREVLPFVPVTTWTQPEGDDSECQRGYGTPENVCVYPMLIWHEEGQKAFDIDSAIYFMQQYPTEKAYIIGESPKELENLLYADPDLGVGLENNQMSRVRTSDYLSFWRNYDTLVYVEEDYEKALVASTYASLMNAPLIIEGTKTDKDAYFKNKRIICIGKIERNCDEKYTLSELQNKYVDRTNTNRVILVNNLDFNRGIKIDSGFGPEKSAEKIKVLYGKTSLVAPVLASAKHEIIINTNEEVYDDIDKDIERQIDRLFKKDSEAEYLTIIASPNDIKMVTSTELGDIAVDSWHYSLLDQDRIPDLKVGRIFGLTTSDVSSNIARTIFFNKTQKNAQKVLSARGNPSYGDAKIVYAIGELFSSLGYDTTIKILLENSAVTSSKFGTNTLNPFWKGKTIINYMDHGNPIWAGIVSVSIPYLDNTLINADACSTCAFDSPFFYSKGNLFCVRSLRRGAIAYIGATSDSLAGGDRTRKFFLGLLIDNMSLGDAFFAVKKVSAYDNPFNLASSRYEVNPYPWYTLIGDPTLKLRLDYLLPLPKLEFVEKINENMKRYNLSFSVFKFSIPKEIQESCQVSDILDCTEPIILTTNPQNDISWVYVDSDSFKEDLDKINYISVIRSDSDILDINTNLDYIEVLLSDSADILDIDTNLKGKTGLLGFEIDKTNLKEGINNFTFDLIVKTVDYGRGKLSPNQIISFENQEIEKTIRDLTNIKSRALTKKDITYIKALDVNEKNLDSSESRSFLRDLKNFKNLKSLFLTGNQIKDITPLKELKYLERLDLSKNQIQNIRPLEELELLGNLDLSRNQIKDITPLKELKYLESLDLSKNQIQNIRPLEELEHLESLDLSKNQIKDITPLEELELLKDLGLSGNQIKDITPLKELEHLESLYLGGNQIEDITPLKGLERLKSLYLAENQITDVAQLKELEHLESLYLISNQIRNVEPLKEMKQLRWLDLAFNEITDVEPLKELEHLEGLALDENQITNIEPLKELKDLKMLYLSYNRITDVEPLKELEHLGYLDLSNNQIKDVSALKELNELQLIDLRGNPDINCNQVAELEEEDIIIYSDC